MDTSDKDKSHYFYFIGCNGRVILIHPFESDE